MRNVERRPVLCFLQRIEGGLFYQKNLLGRARLYVLHSTAASLPVIRVSRPRKHPRASRVASEWPSVFRTPFGPDQATEEGLTYEVTYRNSETNNRLPFAFGGKRLGASGASAKIPLKLARDNWGVTKQWVVLTKSDGSTSSAS